MAATTIDAEKATSHNDVRSSLESTVDFISAPNDLADVLTPHESYEGYEFWDPGFEWSAAEEKRVVLKTDLLLLSVLCLMFFGLQLDRGNLSNALTDNLLKDLHLTTNDYNNGTTIQLVCFLATEFPVQLLTKRFGFRKVLPIMVMLWSTISWSQAWMTDRATFYATRALIGACEGGFIPGTILFATYFYKSNELSVRLAFFWSTLNIARVISALLAAGILQMRNVGGKTGWFWLFLIEGLLTFVIGLFAFLYLPQSPVETKSILCRKEWYTPRQQKIMINRLLRDDPAKGLTAIKEPARLNDIWDAMKDKSMWGLYFIGLIAYIPASPIQAYLSYSLKTVGGFTTLQSNLLTTVSAGCQVITMLILAKSSEFFNERTWHCFFGEFWCLPLIASLLALPNKPLPWPRFTIATLASGYPYFHPIVSSWISQNSFNVKKRALTAATYNVIVQIGSLIASQIYRKSDAPFYHTGNKVLISFCVTSLVVFIAQNLWLRLLNRRKAKVWDRLTDTEKKAYQEDKAARELDGNKRLDFRFVY